MLRDAETKDAAFFEFEVQLLPLVSTGEIVSRRESDPTVTGEIVSRRESDPAVTGKGVDARNLSITLSFGRFLRFGLVIFLLKL